VLDEVFQVDRFPQPDAKVAVAGLGGRAVLAGPLGGPPGEDLNGDRVLAALAREQVDCRGCERLASVPNALSAIFLDAQGDRMIVTHRDDRLAAATPSDPAGLAASVDAVLADNRFPEFVRPICEATRARGLIVVLDADRPTKISDDLFDIATHVVFSSECLRATTGLHDLGAGLAAIAAMTASFLAVTHGPHDVLWRERKRPAYASHVQQGVPRSARQPLPPGRTEGHRKGGEKPACGVFENLRASGAAGDEGRAFGGG
jgi:sulfofructose kinase